MLKRLRYLTVERENAERRAYQRGLADGKQSKQQVDAWFATHFQPPAGTVYADMARAIGSMELCFKGLLDEYPHCRASGRMGKWAAAAHAMIDYMAFVDAPMKRVRIVPEPQG